MERQVHNTSHEQRLERLLLGLGPLEIVVLVDEEKEDEGEDEDGCSPRITEVLDTE